MESLISSSNWIQFVLLIFVGFSNSIRMGARFEIWNKIIILALEFKRSSIDWSKFQYVICSIKQSRCSSSWSIVIRNINAYKWFGRWDANTMPHKVNLSLHFTHRMITAYVDVWMNGLGFFLWKITSLDAPSYCHINK